MDAFEPLHVAAAEGAGYNFEGPSRIKCFGRRASYSPIGFLFNTRWRVDDETES
jgi:hypothetical protein